MAFACIDHGFDRERHTALQLETRARLAVVQNLRVFVIHATDAVAAILAHHRVVALLDEGLNGVSEIAEPCARFHGCDPAPHCLEARFCQSLRMRRWFADEIHAAGIAVETVPDNGDVNVDDVASLEPLVIRNTVTHHVIHRGADGLREPTIIKVCRNRFLHLHDIVVAEAVELVGGHAGDDVLPDHVEHLCGQASGHAHLFLLFSSFYRDMHKLGGAPLSCARVRHCSDSTDML